ncbi:potassium channel subfamily K member 16 [Caerostris darwini]|uniref:Potassium channel subfamily K member 16 n=1 Tax=Caerostris darwini TaxID=1538125 RepID=A0AAV4PWJ3_9ARAC|nr:potassium channel subfamily K member 16 [Caerostris darwini]
MYTKGAVPRGKHKKTRPAFTNNSQDLQKLLAKREHLLQSHNLNDNTDARIELNKINAEIKREYCSIKQSNWQDLCKSLDYKTPNTRLWRLAKKLDKIQPQVENTNSIIGINGTSTVNDKETADALGNYYSEESKLALGRENKKTGRATRKLIRSCRVPASNELFNIPITSSELLYAIQQLDFKKSPGPDGVESILLEKQFTKKEISEIIQNWTPEKRFHYFHGDVHKNSATWSFFNSFMFAFYLCTTIGYGDMSPATAHGQMICILYGIFGIPVNILFYKILGSSYAEAFQETVELVQGNRKGKMWRFAGALTFFIPCVFFFVLVPSSVFVFTDGWTYLEGVYYSFITLTTIGLGDYISGPEAQGGGGPLQGPHEKGEGLQAEALEEPGGPHRHTEGARGGRAAEEREHGADWDLSAHEEEQQQGQRDSRARKGKMIHYKFFFQWSAAEEQSSVNYLEGEKHFKRKTN